MAPLPTWRTQTRFDRLLQSFFKLDSKWQEIGLFFARPFLVCKFIRKISPWQWPWNCGQMAWKGRLEKWKKHLLAYEELEVFIRPPLPRTGRSGFSPFRIKSAGPAFAKAVKRSGTSPFTPQALGTDRIDQLNQMLNVLDQKVGMALNFNSLLFAGVSFLTTWLVGLIEKSGDTPHKTEIIAACQAVAAVTVALLAFTLFILLVGFRRLVWGDLGEKIPEAVPSNRRQVLAAKKRLHIDHLILAVALRTNVFRISTYLSSSALILVLALAGMGGIFGIRNLWQNTYNQEPGGNIVISTDQPTPPSAPPVPPAPPNMPAIKGDSPGPHPADHRNGSGCRSYTRNK